MKRNVLLNIFNIFLFFITLTVFIINLLMLKLEGAIGALVFIMFNSAVLALVANVISLVFSFFDKPKGIDTIASFSRILLFLSAFLYMLCVFAF